MIPASVLNELRRDAVAKLTETILDDYQRPAAGNGGTYAGKPMCRKKARPWNSSSAVIPSTPSGQRLNRGLTSSFLAANRTTIVRSLMQTGSKP